MKPKNVSLTYVGWSDPAPMTSLVLFGMNSSSSQLFDLLQALKSGHFFIPLTYFKATHKENLFDYLSISNPNPYLTLQLLTSTPPKTLNLTAIQTLSL
jgi:hypothetical protein